MRNCAICCPWSGVPAAGVHPVGPLERAFQIAAKSTSPFSTWTASAACPLHGTATGDDPRLGRALAGLNELYRDAGFEPVQGLLPDYLPLVLEFFAAAPDGLGWCWSTGSARNLLAFMPALEARHPDSSYVSLFRPIVAVLGLVPDQRLPAKRLEQV